MKFFCIPLFTCKAGIVDSLDFSQLRLEEVPKEILKSRKFVEELLLNVNGIETLPTEFFRCTKLKKLDVSENKLKVLPSEISGLQLLTDLNLSKNEFVELPEEIGDCCALQSLNISTNIVPGLPKSITHLSQLTSLNVSNNSLTQLPQDIEQLVSLQYLDAGQCELRFLPPSIVALRQLRVLDLCENYLTELPEGLGGLESLEIFDLHNNMINSLPESILQCQSLRTLDVFSNSLNYLPDNIGDLKQLMELNISDNGISHLPSSIGQLRRLEILKAAKNRLMELTPAICSCEHLTDLILCENLLSELPSSLGNLRRLRFLDVNVNNLRHIPVTIGGCQQLGVLAMRHNQLQELPMEVGRLSKLQVLDVADNQLAYLPYTLTVLLQSKTLSALWLSFNQPPLPKLSVVNEPLGNIKVLTCYLLPQKDQHLAPSTSSPSQNKSCVGGARVCFQTTGTSPTTEDKVMPGESQGAEEGEDDEEKLLPIGRFERYDTPHPKPYAPKNRMAAMRNSGDFSNATTATITTSNNNNTTPAAESATTMHHSPPHLAPINLEARPLRSVLKRNRPQSVISLGSMGGKDEGGEPQISKIPDGISATPNVDGKDRPPSTSKRSPTPLSTMLKLSIRRALDGSFGWHLVGGADSIPYKGRSGLFIKRLVDEGAAQMAGFQCDDRLVSVDGRVFTHLTTHHEAVAMLQSSAVVADGKPLEIVVERWEAERNVEDGSRLAALMSPISNITNITVEGSNGDLGINGEMEGGMDAGARKSCGVPSPSLEPEIVSVTLRRGTSGSPGFSVFGSGLTPTDPVRISGFSRGGAAERSGKLCVNDRLLSINGINVKMARHDQVVTLLTGNANEELYLVVERGGPSVLTNTGGISLSRSLPSLVSSLLGSGGGEEIGYDAGRSATKKDVLQQKPGSFSGHQKGRNAPLIQSLSNLLAVDAERESLPGSAFTPVLPTSKAPPPPSQSSSTSIPRPTAMTTVTMKGFDVKPLATSSPIPASGSPSSPKSQLPVMIPASYLQSHGPQVPTKAIHNKPLPPAVAPKPKLVSEVASPSGIPSSQPEKIIPEKLAFSSKLRKFEDEINAQSTSSGRGQAVDSGGAAGRRSGIPMKKPLVSSQDLEKMKAEEMGRGVPPPSVIAYDRLGNRGGDMKIDDNDEAEGEMEREDKLLELSNDPCFNLLMRGGSHPSPSSSAGPHVVRTRKAELRAERSFGSPVPSASSPSAHAPGAALQESTAADTSRASSSLSTLEQRAVELEKRQQWRQARLQSMDVESKRTDEVIKLISSIPSSPIPIQQ